MLGVFSVLRLTFSREKLVFCFSAFLLFLRRCIIVSPYIPHSLSLYLYVPFTQTFGICLAVRGDKNNGKWKMENGKWKRDGHKMRDPASTRLSVSLTNFTPNKFFLSVLFPSNHPSIHPFRGLVCKARERGWI